MGRLEKKSAFLLSILFVYQPLLQVNDAFYGMILTGRGEEKLSSSSCNWKQLAREKIAQEWGLGKKAKVEHKNFIWDFKSKREKEQGRSSTDTTGCLRFISRRKQSLCRSWKAVKVLERLASPAFPELCSEWISRMPLQNELQRHPVSEDSICSLKWRLKCREGETPDQKKLLASTQIKVMKLLFRQRKADPK